MPKPKPPLNETKAEAFKRIGGQRTQKAIDAITVIGHLANKSFYDYTPEQIDKIQMLLENAVIKLINKFEGKTETQKRTIEL